MQLATMSEHGQREVRAVRPDSGPDARWAKAPVASSYLTRPDYRQVGLRSLVFGKTDADAVAYMAKARWGALGKDVQVCPSCGEVAQHYPVSRTGGWKCRSKTCGKQFTIFSGTKLHRTKHTPLEILSQAIHFMEAKDSISSREMSGIHERAAQTSRILTLKFREAIRHTMLAEPPLTGYVQADAAFFMKYVRPANAGNGAALSAKAEQKNAGLNENGKVANTVSKNMHAVVVFVQTGPQGSRRYKVAMVKTENQVDMLTLGKQFCNEHTLLTTDGHSAYSYMENIVLDHRTVNHSVEYMTKDGDHTNHAEGFFARLRAAIHGAWHKTTIGHLEEYAWEFAWRQTMVGSNNKEQLDDLLRRILNSGRSERYVDYWNSRGDKERLPPEELRGIVEVDKNDVSKRRGRPRLGTVSPKKVEREKRPYRRKAKDAPAAGEQPDAQA